MVFRLSRRFPRRPYRRNFLLWSSGAEIVPKVASDTLGLSISETTVVQANLTGSDAVNLALTETTVTQASASASDTAGLVIIDANTGLLVTQPASDTLGLALTEAIAAQVAFSASDTVSLGVTEGASAVAVTLAGSDALEITITESVASIEISLSGTDTLALGITSQNQLRALLSGSDTVALGVPESTELTVQTAASDTVALATTEGATVEAAVSASDAVDLALTDASVAPVQSNLYGAEDLPDLLDEIGTCVRAVTGIRDVDEFEPTNLGALPRAVLRYRETPWTLTINRDEIRHELAIDVIFAPVEEWKRARREASRIINDVKAQLRPGPSQCIESGTVSMGVDTLRERWYHDNKYVVATINIKVVEVSNVTFA